MMTVDIKIDGKRKGWIEFVYLDITGRKKTVCSVLAIQEVPGKKPFKFDSKKARYVPDQGMMQQLANVLAALGWTAKPWSVSK